MKEGRHIIRYPITPVPKPRQTRRDKWLNPPRPAVERYRCFADACRQLNVYLPSSDAAIQFIVPMPKSWSNKKKHAMKGKPHTQRPDISNMLKALEDAVHGEDSHIWHYSGLSKIWGVDGAIKISMGGSIIIDD
jgi:Holliday junction resolvase RusA-like endonuclease